MKVIHSDHRIRKALVVGLGVSGQAVCELLLRRGIRVRATDSRERASFAGRLDRLEALGCELTLGTHVATDFLEADQILLSPGVPGDIAPLKTASKQGIEILGELEWAWRQVQEPVIAVTGTNGKTTTTTIIGELLKAAGKRVFVGGNIGTPLSRWLLDRAQRAKTPATQRASQIDFLVLEVSSFQLDTAPSFAPHVGILLNISEDHLDRYPSFSAYIASKASLFEHQGASDFAVLNLDDPHCREWIGAIRSQVLTFSRTDPAANAFCANRRMTVRLPNRDAFSLDLADCPLAGVHNEENLMAAILCTSALGLEVSALQNALPEIRPLPHRIEWVGSWQGIDFYNDSKGTNVGAVVKALQNFDTPVLLLMGGRDKEGSYEPLQPVVRGKVKYVGCYGDAGPRLYDALSRWAAAGRFPGLAEAFAEAVAIARAGDSVLLSPGCSSFDQYRNYAERGNHFKQLVAALNRPAAATPALDRIEERNG